MDYAKRSTYRVELTEQEAYLVGLALDLLVEIAPLDESEAINDLINFSIDWDSMIGMDGKDYIDRSDCDDCDDCDECDCCCEED